MTKDSGSPKAGERGERSPVPRQAEEPVSAEVVEAQPVDELQQLRDEAAARLDDARRIKAEFENYKKRMLREQTTQIERASSGIVEQMLPVLDAFKLALIAGERARPENGSDYQSLVRGVELVYGELIDVMRKEGLEEIEAEGKPFDPSEHEAVMETGEFADGQPYVAEVMRTGYRLRGRVLRPAMVKVERR